MKSIAGLDNIDVEEDGEPHPNKVLSTKSSLLDEEEKNDDNNMSKDKDSNKMTTDGKDRVGEEGGVDDLIKGVKSCTINTDQSKELSEAVKNLTISEEKQEHDNGEVDGQKQLHPKGEPQEDDERGDSVSRDKQQQPEVVVGTEKDQSTTGKTEVPMVPLGPPTYYPVTEEENESECCPEGQLLERGGPMAGVASAYKYQEPNSFLPSQANFQMPDNFPNYSYMGQAGQTYMGHGKRTMETQEMYYEPPKYTRPVGADLFVNTAGLTNNFNNLDAPGLTSQGSKKTTNVYRKQMSGGTMYAPDDNLDIPVDQLSAGPWMPTDPLDIQNQLNIPLEDEINFSDMENFLEGIGNVPVTSVPIQSSAYGMNNNVSVSPQSRPLPPVGTLRQPVLNHYQNQVNVPQTFYIKSQQMPTNIPQTLDATNMNTAQTFQSSLHQQQPVYSAQMGPQIPRRHQQQQIQQIPQYPLPQTQSLPYQITQITQSALDSAQVEDTGYGSDPNSPGQDSQIACSPSSPYMSPPRHATFSPPLSVKSVASQDSGVSSPMSDHQQESCDHHDPFIDTHLLDLNDALSIASKDLLEKASNQKSIHTLSPTIPNIETEQEAVPKPMPTPTVAQGIQVQNPAVMVTQQGVMVIPPDALPTTVTAVSFPTTLPNQREVQKPSSPKKSISPLMTVGGKGQPILTGSGRMAPQVNKEGKVAIPPTPRPKNPNCRAPVMPPVAPGPFIIMPPISGPIKQAPRFIPIAPREPLNTNRPSSSSAQPARPQARQVARAVGAPGPQRAANGPHPGYGAPGGCGGAGRQPNRPATDSLLTLARRLVAEMLREDLLFQDDECDTYLHVAVCRADRFMVEALLERLERAELSEMKDKQNIMGQTPLYLAVSTNHPEMVRLLVRFGAAAKPLAQIKLPSGNLEQTAAIHCAASRGENYLNTLLALLKAKDIDLNQVNSDGHTALHCAILCHAKTAPDQPPINNIPIIKALIQNGADPNQQVQQNGKTALMYALESHDLDLIESTFQAVDPAKLPTFLRTQSFDNNTCLKIAENFKQRLPPIGQQRLMACVKPNTYYRGGSSSPTSSSSMSPIQQSPTR